MKEPLLLKIGRALDNDVILNIPFISDYHLEIFQDPEGNVFMTDLNSANGTFVNGKRLNGFIMLQPKDEVFLGNGFKMHWEQLLVNPKAAPTEPQNSKVTVDKEPKKYVDAFASLKEEKKQQQEKQTQKTPKVKKSFFQENKDVIIIWGLIFAFIVYWYFRVS